jgi:TolB-like protein
VYFVYNSFQQTTKENITSKVEQQIEKSIAVLPFINMSSDKENEYFSDGITEEITTQLSKIADLKVIARTSAMHYKGSKKSIKEIAEELHVASILEGSVQKSGNEIKITAQLIDANTQEHIWVDKYEKDLKDVFSIQNEVASHIAVALQAKLFKPADNQAIKKETENPEAYNLYLKGRFYLNRGAGNDLKKAIEYFEQAIEKDTGYARAYAGIADSYLMLGEFEFLPGIEAWPKAEVFARKALLMNETLADAHNSLGHLSIHRFNWSTAERELKRAIELNPGYADAHHFFSQYLSNFGLMDSSIAEALRSQALDPLSLLVSSTVGLQYYRARRWKEAEVQFKQTLEMHPDYLRARRNLGRVYLAKGMNREAISELEKSVALAKNNPVALGYLGNAYGLNGEKDKALNILDKLRMMTDKKYISGEIAIVYIGLGDKYKAFEWLNKACEELSTILLHIKVDWVFDPIRSDPRFSLLLKKMGLE